MNEFANIIVQQIAIWMPAVTAIAGVIATVFAAVNKAKTAIKEVRNTDDFKALKQTVAQQAQSNEELRAQIELLTDTIARIEGYSNTKLEK